MSYVDDLRIQILASCDQADDALDDIDRTGPGIIRAFVTVWLRPYPVPPVAVAAVAATYILLLDQIVRYARAAVAAIRVGAMVLGSPDNLRATADLLGDKVGTESANLGAVTTLASLEAVSESNWDDGLASETYHNSVDGRAGAVLRINDLVSPLVDALRDLANGIERYYVELLTLTISLVALIGGIIGAIVSAIPTWGAGAVVGLIFAFVGLVGSLGSGISMFLNLSQNVNDSLSKMLAGSVPWPTSQFAI